MKVGYIQTSPVFGEVKKNIEKAVSQINKIDADLNDLLKDRRIDLIDELL